MSAFRKLKSRRTSDVGGRKPSPSRDSTETDGPLITREDVKKRTTNKHITDMPPDKDLEERVLFDKSEYLTDNLPADDVAPMMATKNLLTQRELIEYNAMKRAGMSTVRLSEYLLECLRKRKAGFLKTFCAILWEIEPAKYLINDIQETYYALQRANRLSRVSLSDTDLSQRTKGSMNPEPCMTCKKLKKQNKQLEKKNRELSEQVRELGERCEQHKEARIKIETHLETLQDQFAKQEVMERQKLTKVVPVLEEAIMLIRKTATVDTSGAQQTLTKISDLLSKEASYEKSSRYNASTKNRESTISALSDCSSIAESTIVTEQTSSTSGGRQRSMSQTEVTQLTLGSRGRPDIPNKPTQAAAVKEPTSDNLSLLGIPTEGTQGRDAKRANSHPKRGRHHSLSGAAENSIMRNRSQSYSLQHSHTKIEHNARQVASQATFDVELQDKLDKRRQVLEQWNTEVEKK